MSVLNTMSVGDVLYYVVDAIPSHSAPKGSVAIFDNPLDNSKHFFVNNDGDTTWLKSITPSYGGNYLFENTTEKRTSDQNSWVVFAQLPWNDIDANNGITASFDFNEARVTYTGSTLIRAFNSIKTTMMGGTSKWMDFQFGYVTNNFLYDGWQGGTGPDNADLVSINTNGVRTLNYEDTLSTAMRWTDKETGGGPSTREYGIRNCTFSLHKIDEPITVFFYEGWESSGFTDNGWTVVNDTTNVWVVGQADSKDGLSSAYISNDGGTSNAYTITTANVSHFYKDFTIPDEYNYIYLVFDWKCFGERNNSSPTSFDYGAVVITTTGTTPVAGTEVSTVNVAVDVNGAPTGLDGRIGRFISDSGNRGKYAFSNTNWHVEVIDLSAYKGQTKRIVFTWKNDATVDGNPPMNIDNIRFQFF